MSILRVSVAAAGAALAAAWGALGHMLVAQIARDVMQPETRDAVDAIIALLADTYTASPDFVTAACWADDLKGLAEHIEDPLHYIDVPYVKDDVPGAPAQLNVSSNPWAINQGVATLRSSAALDLDRARALRFVLHFVGDLHQPLHATSLFSNDFLPPDGDVGGNRYTITGTTSRNLHSLWDNGLDNWSPAPPRPLTPAGNETVTTAAAAIAAEFPPSAFGPELDETDPFVWTQESYKVAVDFVYTCPQASEGAVPQAYLDAGFDIARKQVALGGYRLGKLLDSVYAAAAPAPKRAALRGAVAARR